MGTKMEMLGSKSLQMFQEPVLYQPGILVCIWTQLE